MDKSFLAKFWHEKLKDYKNNSHLFVKANGNLYFISPNEACPKDFKGHGGAKIKFVLGDKEIISTNVWYSGEIPAYLANEFGPEYQLIWIGHE